jgi:hypothetical protein
LTSARLASQAPDGGLLCLMVDGDDLEMWRLADDKRVRKTRMTGVREILATPQGCVVVDEQATRYLDTTGGSQELCPPARAVASAGDEILAAIKTSLYVFGHSGRTREVLQVAPGATAIYADRDWFVMGYRDGDLEWIPRGREAVAPRRYLEQRPSSPVVRVLPGPMGTLIVGYLNGQVGIWEIETGFLLDAAKLHGPAVHLSLREAELVVATDLGDFIRWDLSPLFEEYCRLLRRLWAEVPITWEKGGPVRSPPDTSHTCYESGEGG